MECVTSESAVKISKNSKSYLKVKTFILKACWKNWNQTYEIELRDSVPIWLKYDALMYIIEITSVSIGV